MPVNSFENYPMSWKPTLPSRKGAIYAHLAMQLAADIRDGVLKPGDKLPPQRELADYLDLNLSTVTRAYKLCEAQGLICAKVGQGTFVSSDVNTSDTLLYPNEELDFVQLGTVLPPYNGNQRVIEFIKGLLSQPDIHSFLEYRSPNGTAVQRRTFAAWVRSTGVPAAPEDILFATGGQNALCGAILGLFRSGDRVGVNSLSFSGFKSIAKMTGLQLVPLPEEGGKVRFDQLEAFCRSENLKGLYFIPDYHNPTTYTMTPEERALVGAAAKNLGLVILEDAINYVFSWERYAPIAAYAPEQTILILSTSKFLCAGLRVACLAVPAQYRQSVESALYNMNLMVSPFTLEIVNRIFTSPLLEELIDEKRAELAQRDRLATQLLGDYEMYGGAACSFRWLLLPQAWDSQDFENRARALGVQVFCSDRFTIGKTVPPKAVRISISSPQSQGELEKGLAILRELLAEK